MLMLLVVYSIRPVKKIVSEKKKKKRKEKMSRLKRVEIWVEKG